MARSIPVCGYQRYYRCNAFGLYIYLWGFFSMVHLLSGDGHKEISFLLGKWSSPPLLRILLRKWLYMMYSSVSEVYIYLWGLRSPWFISLQRWFQQGNGIIAPFYRSFPKGSSYRRIFPPLLAGLSGWLDLLGTLSSFCQDGIRECHPGSLSLVITFYESYYTGSHYGAQPAPTPLEAAHVASLFLCQMVWAMLINHAVILLLSYSIIWIELHPIKNSRRLGKHWLNRCQNSLLNFYA